MGNKSKLLKYIGILLAVFIIFIGFNNTSNAASNIDEANDLGDLMTLAADENTWYNYNPADIINKTIEDKNDTINNPYAYCIDPHTSHSGLRYHIANIIDVSCNTTENEVRVYGDTEKYKNGVPFDPTKEKNVKPYIMLAYLAEGAQRNPIPKTPSYKDAIARMFWDSSYVKQMQQVGLSKNIKAKGSGYAPKTNKYIAEAIKFANEIMKSSSLSTSYIKENMTEKQKENVTAFKLNGKTFIGPYKITLGNKCKVKEIKINGSIKADKITTDTKTYKKKKNVSKTPSNKMFYIVVNKEIDDVSTIEIIGNKSVKTIDARLMILSGGVAQNFMVYNAKKEEVPATLELEIPKKGTLEVEKKDEFDASLNFEGIGFKFYNTKKGYVAKENEKIVFKSTFSEAYEFKTGKDGKVTLKDIPVGKYKIYETSLPAELQKYYKLGKRDVAGGGKEYETANLVKDKDGNYIFTVSSGTHTITAENKRASTSLQIIKKDADSGKTLEGIEFKLYKLGTEHGWVTVNSKNEYTGVNDKDFYAKDVAILRTDKNGKTQTITGLPLGKYQIFETGLGEYSDVYELGTYRMYGADLPAKLIDTKKLEANKAGLVTIEEKNKQEYINISGKVWLDKLKYKNTSSRNSQYDSNDELLQGIKVELINKATNETLQTAYTDANGAYKFTKVKISDLANLIVRFTYNGYTYEDVISQTNEVQNTENTSKAVEDNTRDYLNGLFTELYGEGQKLSNGTLLEYNKTDNGVKLTDNTINALPKVQANTNNGWLKTYYDLLSKNGKVKEITNVNLGLYERDMPNITVQKDIDSAVLSINEMDYTYHYNKKLTGDTATETPLGVDFDGDYALPVYKADVNYNPQGAGKGLEATVIYKIKLQNASTNQYVKINKIKEAFSRNYTLLENEIYISDSNKFDGSATKLSGVKLDSIVSNQSRGSSNTEYSYGNLIFNEPIKLAPSKVKDGNTKYIYIKFKVNDIKEEYRLATEEQPQSNLKNIVEIESYSVYSDANYSKLYAGVDNTSIPWNLDLASYSPNEDDNDKAPGLKVVDAGDRKFSGTVFEDNDADGLTGAGQERKGDGKLDDGEKVIGNIKVKLVDIDKNEEENTVYNGENFVSSETTTDANGNFTISGFIPGKYKIVYTWGDENGYKVADYKSTIYNAPDDWFTNNVDKYSIAMDNYETRLKIDEDELRESGTEIKTMESKSNEFTVGIEASESEEALGINKEGGKEIFKNQKFLFETNNINFGIIERPRQVLDIEKKLKSLVVTLENGQTIADASIENGELKVKTGAEYISGGEDLGYIWLQIDKSITQSMNAKVKYDITVANNSEKDYDSEKYYKYGIVDGNEVLMKLKAKDVYDYMKGEELSSEATTWETIKAGNYIIGTTDEQTVAERCFNEQYDKYKDANGKVSGTIEWKNENSETKAIYKSWLDDINQTDEVVTLRNVKLAERTIAKYNGEELKQQLTPGASVTAEIETSKIIANGDDIRFDNDAEISEIEFTAEQRTGRKPSAYTSKTYDRAGWVSITPATGEDRDYTWIIVTAISAIAVLGVGIIFIKKKILK